VESESTVRLRLIENAWREEGFAVASVQAGEFRKLRAMREVNDGPDIFDAAHRADTILRVPEWLIGYMRDAIGQSERTSEPLDLARLVRRTMLPMSVLLAAKSLAEHVNNEASEVPDPYQRWTSLADAEAEDAKEEDGSAPWGRDDVFDQAAKERNLDKEGILDKEEDDGEMSAGA
jgi:hypothetical protein